MWDMGAAFKNATGIFCDTVNNGQRKDIRGVQGVRKIHNLAYRLSGTIEEAEVSAYGMGRVFGP